MHSFFFNFTFLWHLLGSRPKHFVPTVSQNNKLVAVLVTIFWLKRNIINTKVTKTVSGNNLCYEEVTAAESGG